MAEEIPTLVIDPRDEEEMVASVIDDLPDEITDRSRAHWIIAAIEATGSIYAMCTYWINQWPTKLLLKVIELLGIERESATAATATLTFTSAASTVTDVTVPAGTVVKTGSGADAIEFATDVALTVPSGGGTANVAATATETGAATNVSAGTLTKLDVPVAGIASVTNASAASGGQDLESLDQMIARTPLAVRKQNRIVTGEDAADEAARVDGVSRAKALGTYYLSEGVLERSVGVYAVGLLLDGTLNDGTLSSELETEIRDALKAKALGGVGFSIFLAPVRLVMIESVEVVLKTGYVLADVEAAIEAALVEYLTAYDIIGDDGRTITGSAWEWGETLYANEVISLIDRVEGVKRVGAITYRYSDNYGGTWFPTHPASALSLADISPGDPLSNVVEMFGLIHWGGDYSPPFEFSVSEA
jgi:uncharacterized phage protein gp47/JayE